MTIASKKIYMVEFNTPPIKGNDETVFYFPKVSSIFEVFTPEQIGCGKHRLWNRGAAKGQTIECKHCTVRTLAIFSK